MTYLVDEGECCIVHIVSETFHHIGPCPGICHLVIIFKPITTANLVSINHHVQILKCTKLATLLQTELELQPIETLNT